MLVCSFFNDVSMLTSSLLMEMGFSTDFYESKYMYLTDFLPTDDLDSLLTKTKLQVDTWM